MRRQPAEAKQLFRFFYDRLKPLGVLNKLELTYRVELVALVARLHGHHRDWRGDHYVRGQFKKARSEAPRRIRMVQSKVRKVAAALRDLGEYVEPLRDELLGEMILGIGLAVSREERIPTPEELLAEASRFEKMRPARLAEIEADIKASVHALPGATSVRAVRDYAVSELTTFLVTTCGPSSAEADVRIGKIANALLGSNVKVVEHRVQATSDAAPRASGPAAGAPRWSVAKKNRENR